MRDPVPFGVLAIGQASLSLRAAAILVLIVPALLGGCVPAELAGMPPSFGAFLRRNGMEFTRQMPPAGGAAAIAAIARQEGPFPAAAVNPPVYGVLSCPVRCSGAVLSQPGEAIEAWFVSYPGTEYGGVDIAWVLIDPAMGVRVLSTRDNP